jgi:hypothetical protein
MTGSVTCTTAFTSIRLRRPFIAPEPLGGWYVVIGSQGWLCGDREEALHEFRDLDHIERGYG